MKMRKSMLLTAAGLAICLVGAIGLTGCGSSDEAAVEDTTAAVEEPVDMEAAEEAADAAEEAAEEAAEAAVDTTPDQDGAQAEIGEKKALKIAMRDAGVSKSDITYSNVHLDYDDGRTEYEIEFQVGTTEYEYAIDAYTGDIYERDIESALD